jgi:thymidylate kinase/MoaA/NifB/PqqE/SkfB family radical SAM enzyme
MKEQKAALTADWDYRVDVVAAAAGKFLCNYNCPFCHKDYFAQSVPPQTTRLSLAEGVSLCGQILPGKFTIHLGGSGEPLAVKPHAFAEAVSPLTELSDCLSVSLTTNGYFLRDRLDDLLGLGIQDVNVSIPCLEPDQYARIMKVPPERARDIVARTLDGITKAREREIEVDVNVCVSYDLLPHIEAFLELSRRCNVRIKFFPIIAAPHLNVAAENRFFNDLVAALTRRALPRIEGGGRYLTVVWSIGGAVLCAKPGDVYLRPYECYECNAFLRCEESCWRSVRVSPWYIQPCGIRPERLYWYAENNLANLRQLLVEGGKLPGRIHQYDELRSSALQQLQHARRFRFVVLEGPDGSGKSELSKRLAQRLGYLRYRTPPEVFQNNDIKRALEQTGLEVARYLFYLSAMHYADLEVRSLLGCAGVISDRWLLSTRLYHQALLRREIGLPGEYHDQILKPDLTIVLDVDEPQQAERLQKRTREFDKKWEEQADLRAAINHMYRESTSSGVVHVDNNGNLEETLDKCFASVKQLGQP